MFKLLQATTKQLFRDKEALFWMFLFPMIFILIFKLFNFSGSVNAYILVIDKSNNEISQSLIDSLGKVKGIGINKDFTDLENANEALKSSQKAEFAFYDNEKEENFKDNKQVNLVLLIPENYGNFANLATNPDEKFNIEMYYNQTDEGQASPSGIVSSIINEITTNITLQVAGTTNHFSLDRKGLSVNEITYYDMLVPGIIGMGIMQSGIIGMATTIASLKEKQVLKRLSATPLPIWKFILAEIVTYLGLSMIQVTIMIFVSKYLLGANTYGSIPLMYFLAFISNFVFLSIGFIAASLSKSTNAAASLAQVFTTPMMFLSGVFFDRESLPGVVKTIADYLPLSPLLDALRAVSLQGESIGDLKPELLILFVWTIIAFLIASLIFKFREE